MIDGAFVDAASGKTFPVVDPRTEKVVIEVAEADKEDVDRAVKAARRAFDEGPWPRFTGRERGRILFRFADLLEAHLEELAQLETLDNGKPLSVSRSTDIPSVISHLRYFAGWADKITGKTVPVDGSFFAYTLHEPVGVVGQIIPWNFPLLMMAWKIAPALAAGNTVVLKCAEQTPLTALRAAELALEAGIPNGVLNVLPGYGPTAGAALASHPDVDKIAFTGSTEVGQKIMQMASGNLKNISLELGGKSPLIVFPDFDLDSAVATAHFALFFNHGQCCNAGSRLFVHSSLFDQFVEKAVKVATERVVGDPFTDVDQGPQVNQEQFAKIMGYIDSGNKQGADMVCGGHRIGERGYYIEPTVFANVKDEMDIARDEIFGPVQSILKFENIDEVIRRANDTTYGLAAGVLTNDLHTANRVSRSLKAGTVWINAYHGFDDALPFGGYKMSGIGRDKSGYALANYTEVKTVMMPLKDSPWL